MKHFIFTLTLLFLIVIHADGQTDSKHFSYTTYIGTGLSMGQPSQTPFNWQIIAHYHIGQRFTIGAGSGLSIYEKALIPLYANAQFFMTRPKKLTPYLECNIGGCQRNQWRILSFTICRSTGKAHSKTKNEYCLRL